MLTKHCRNVSRFMELLSARERLMSKGECRVPPRGSTFCTIGYRQGGAPPRGRTAMRSTLLRDSLNLPYDSYKRYRHVTPRVSTARYHHEWVLSGTTESEYCQIPPRVSTARYHHEWVAPDTTTKWVQPGTTTSEYCQVPPRVRTVRYNHEWVLSGTTMSEYRQIPPLNEYSQVPPRVSTARYHH